MTVALVTGAAGFFGQAIVSALAHLGCEVVATDRLERDAFSLRTGTPSALVSYVQRDLTEDGIDDIVAEVDGVVHRASVTRCCEQTSGRFPEFFRPSVRLATAVGSS